jgi:hypothetical protein
MGVQTSSGEYFEVRSLFTIHLVDITQYEGQNQFWWNTQNIPHGSQEYKLAASKLQVHCKLRPYKGAKNCAYIYHLVNIPQNVSSIEVCITPGPSVAIDGQTQFFKKKKNLANRLLLALQENMIFLTQKGATHDTCEINCMFSCMKVYNMWCLLWHVLHWKWEFDISSCTYYAHMRDYTQIN